MADSKELYYFTSARYGLEAVKNGRIKVAQFDKTNDPFELLSLLPNETLTHEILETTRTNLSTYFKAVCLSEEYRSPTLWGHYADKGKGVCLRFDVDLKTSSNQLAFQPMKYIEHRILNPLDSDNKDIEDAEWDKVKTDMHIDMMIHKSLHWEYEKEWRILVDSESEFVILDPLTGLSFLMFPDHMKLSEVLIGFRCEEENIVRRFEILLDSYPSPPKVVRTYLSRSAFVIEKEN